MGFDITGLGSVFDFLSKGIDKLFPDKDQADKIKLEMFKLNQEGAFKELELQFDSMKAQIDVNKTEAASSNVFVSGWRPAVGWVCVSAYAFNYIVMPLANWIVKFGDIAAPAVGWVCVSAYAFNYIVMPLANWIVKFGDIAAPAIVALDTGELTTLLFGMLGIGAMRSYDKTKGVK